MDENNIRKKKNIVSPLPVFLQGWFKQVLLAKSFAKTTGEL